MYKPPWQIDLARAKHDETLKRPTVFCFRQESEGP